MFDGVFTSRRVVTRLRVVMVGLLSYGASLACARSGSQPDCASAGSAAAGRSGPWRLAVHVPASVRRGDSVSLALIIQNLGDSARDPRVGEPSNANFVVTRPGDTTEVWSAHHSVQLLSILLRKGVVAPGDSLQMERRWDQRGNNRQPIPVGVYCVRGNLRAGGFDSVWTEVATLRVLP
jgi:hypothetical protein